MRGNEEQIKAMIQDYREKLRKMMEEQIKKCQKGYILLGNPWAVGHKCNGCIFELSCSNGE